MSSSEDSKDSSNYKTILECFESVVSNQGYKLRVSEEPGVVSFYLYKGLSEANSLVYYGAFVFRDDICEISSLKKYRVAPNHKFPFPLLAMMLYLCILKWKPHSFELTPMAGGNYHKGKDFCLLCYYQKFGFQPEPFTWKPPTIGWSGVIMAVQTDVLKTNVERMLSNDKVCSEILIKS